MLQLANKVFGGLPCERRVARSKPFAIFPVAGRAGDDAARGIAAMVEVHRLPIRADSRGGGHLRIMPGHCRPLSAAELPRDPAHLRVLPPSVCIGVELPLQITGVEPCKARRARTVAIPVETVAGEARVLRPRPGTRQCDHFAAGGEPFGRSRLGLSAAPQQREKCKSKAVAHAASTVPARRLFRAAAAAALLLSATACKGEPEARREMPLADAAQGRAIAQGVGCGACHVLPGIAWPQGTLGPPLDRLAERGLIGGALPNRPDVLAAYIRNAPAMVPGSGMPAMPLSAAEARDVAAWLYQQGGE